MIHISYIIATYNRKDTLGLTLDSLLQQERQDPEREAGIEIIVADNNSTDGTAELIGQYSARHPFIQRFQVPEQGVCHARNAGIQAARGEWIIFVDDDVILQPDWTRRALAFVQAHPEVQFFGGRILPIWPQGFTPPAWMKDGILGRLAIQDAGDSPIVSLAPDHMPYGAAVGFKRSLFARFGLYSTHMIVSEDTEFTLRLVRNGVHYAYLPDLVSHHHMHPHRLNKRYFYRWSFQRGLYWKYVPRIEELIPLYRSMHQPHLNPAGIPIWLLGSALSTAWKSLFIQDEYQKLMHQCYAWADWGGFVGAFKDPRPFQRARREKQHGH